jgi:ribulose-phosphate 3-epimerase
VSRKLVANCGARLASPIARWPVPRSNVGSNLHLHIGVKSDPIEYRYSWDWLLQILSEEGVHHLQIGTFFELYHLPDSEFIALREKAESLGVEISSVFTAHRELGGFFRGNTEWESVALRNYQRLIRVGALLGARSVGSNPGSVMRDRMDLKRSGIRSYIDSMKQLMHLAFQEGIEVLTIEPMSCLAEPPTLPSELEEIAGELSAHHLRFPDDTARVGYCFDISHGYVDEDRVQRYSAFELLEAALPYVTELHLKNTDSFLESTFGFTPEDRARGIVDVAAVRDYLVTHADALPRDLIGYLEIGGPKLGRDYSDRELERQLRVSIRYLQEQFATLPAELADRVEAPPEIWPAAVLSNPPPPAAPAIKIAPSMMCADMGRMRDQIQELESIGVDLLHWDIMDAHFVPNMPCGLVLLEQMRNLTSLPFDVHLMVEDNDFFIAALAKIGVEMISVHHESARHSDRTLSLIKESGAAAGIALNPATPPAVMEYLAHLLDFVLVMTVNPGFAGQRLCASGLAKIAGCKKWLSSAGLSIPIEVDGNVSFDNIPRMVEAGADILVAGTSSLFSSSGTLHKNAGRLRAAIAAGWRGQEQATELIADK